MVPEHAVIVCDSAGFYADFDRGPSSHLAVWV